MLTVEKGLWYPHAARLMAERGKTDPATGHTMMSNDEAQRFLGFFYHLKRPMQRAVLKEMEHCGLVQRVSRERIVIPRRGEE